MPACDLDRSVAFCFYNKREKPNTLVSVFSGEVQSAGQEALIKGSFGVPYRQHPFETAVRRCPALPHASLPIRHPGKFADGQMDRSFGGFVFHRADGMVRRRLLLLEPGRCGRPSHRRGGHNARSRLPVLVLVQILLSVCICLARGFVDSSGQDRGPNSRSGGCLSG